MKVLSIGSPGTEIIIHSVRKYCLFALYVVTPDPAIQTRISTVRKHSVLRVNHEYHMFSIVTVARDQTKPGSLLARPRR